MRPPTTARTSASGWRVSAGRYIASAHQLVPTTPIRTFSFTTTSGRLAIAPGAPERCSAPGASEALDADRPEVLAVAAGALARVAHAREDVLLHDDPAAVADLARARRACRGSPRSPCPARRTRRGRPTRARPTPFSRERGHDGRIAVLEVDVPDAIAELADGRDRVAAGAEASSARCRGTGRARTGRSCRTGAGPPPRSRPGADVLVDDGPDPGLVHHPAGDEVRAVGEDLPLLLGHRVRGRDAAGDRRPVRVAVRVVARAPRRPRGPPTVARAACRSAPRRPRSGRGGPGSRD